MVIKLGLIEDNSLLLDSYKDFFTNDGNFDILFSIPDIKGLLKLRLPHSPDIILLDMMLASGNSLHLIHVIKQSFPHASIIILSSVSDPLMSKIALQKGANGYLLKSSSLQFIKDALLKAYEGGTPLSPSIVNHLLAFKSNEYTLEEAHPTLTKKEKELIYMLRTGMSNKMAASILNVTYFTINQHMKNIYKKLKIHSKSELISITASF